MYDFANPKSTNIIIQNKGFMFSRHFENRSSKSYIADAVATSAGLE